MALPRSLFALTALAALSGCANLPSSGPTATAIVDASHKAGAAPAFDIVEVTPAVLAQLDPPAIGAGGASAQLGPTPRSDLIGPGDGLQVSIFEVGATLFSGRSGAAEAVSSAIGEALPLIRVGADGWAVFPYVGRLHAQGLTADALAAEIQAGLARKSQAPQVVVTVKDNVAETVIVMGDVKKPGRIPLTQAHERILDAIALAGGPVNALQDDFVHLRRGGGEVTLPLADLRAGSADDLTLAPLDRVELIYRPRTFTVFGAAGKVTEVPFQNPRVSLAEALARVGGPSDQQADPSAIFVFRYDATGPEGGPAPGARPIAYRLDLRRAQSYLLAQQFEMHSRDVVYIANAAANEPAKLLQILNLFFQPFYTARTISQ